LTITSAARTPYERRRALSIEGRPLLRALSARRRRGTMAGVSTDQLEKTFVTRASGCIATLP
jgi:hypothetical protein